MTSEKALSGQNGHAKNDDQLVSNLSFVQENARGCRLAWSRLVDLGSIDSGSNPGSPTINFYFRLDYFCFAWITLVAISISTTLNFVNAYKAKISVKSNKPYLINFFFVNLLGDSINCGPVSEICL